MNFKIKWLLIFMVCIGLFHMSTPLTFAEGTGSGMGNPGTVTPTPENPDPAGEEGGVGGHEGTGSGSGPSGSVTDPEAKTSEDNDSIFVPDWYKELSKKADTLKDNIAKIASGEFIEDMINGMIIGWADKLATPLYGTFAKVFLFSPEVADIPIIYKAWS